MVKYFHCTLAELPKSEIFNKIYNVRDIFKLRVEIEKFTAAKKAPPMLSLPTVLSCCC